MLRSASAHRHRARRAAEDGDARRAGGGNPGERVQSVQHLCVKRLPRCGLIAIARLDGRDEDAIDAISQVHGVGPRQRSEKESSANQQDETERDLDDDENADNRPVELLRA